MSLKKLKDAKFVDGGEIAVGWYPNFSLNLSAGVNFAQIMSGRLTITAAAGKDTADFVQFVLNVSIGLPKYIPIVGGMELASAELGGGSQKVWGAVTVLSLIKVGFTYYWGKGIEFTHGSAGGLETFAVLSPGDDEGRSTHKGTVQCNDYPPFRWEQTPIPAKNSLPQSAEICCTAPEAPQLPTLTKGWRHSLSPEYVL